MHSQLKSIVFESDARGFSLIEVLVVITMLLLVAAISAPKMATMMANSDFRTDVRALMTAIKTARMEAVTRNQLCSITFSTNAAGEDTYTVYVDNNQDLIFDAPADPLNIDPLTEDEPLIYLFPPYTGTFKNAIIFNNTMLANAAGDEANAFNGRGMPLNAAGGFGGGTISLRGNTSVDKQTRSGINRDIVLSTVGRMRIAYP